MWGDADVRTLFARKTFCSPSDMLRFYTKATFIGVSLCLLVVAFIITTFSFDVLGLSIPYSRFGLFVRTYLTISIPLWTFIFVWKAIAEGHVFRPYLARLVDLERGRAIHKLTSRLAHDITPLSETLRSISKDSESLEESDRFRLNVVSRHLEAIEQDLKSTYKKLDELDGTPKFCFPIEAIKNVSDQLSSLAREHAVEIKLSISKSSHILGVAVPSTEIERIFSNLLRNSIYASPPGSRVTVSGQQRGRSLQYRVEDNGPGMASEILDTVRHEGVSSKKGGAGLGLRIVREIISEAQGRFAIRSRPGRGTTVVVTLPTAKIPDWMTFDISIPENRQVVVVEESETTRDLWNSRMKKASVQFVGDLLHFDLGQYPRESTFFIFGHNKYGSAINVFDVINENTLGAISLVTTAHFNDPSIQKRAADAGAKIIPQHLIAQSEIVVGS